MTLRNRTLNGSRVCAAAIASIVAVGALSAVQPAAREIPILPDQRLEVELDTGSSVRVSVWDRDAVSVEAAFGEPEAGNIRLEIVETSFGARVTSSFRDPRRRGSRGGEVRIRVPRWLELDLNTTGGELEVDGVEGDVSGQTMGGNLVLRDLRGELDVKTLGGNIELTDSDVGGSVETMGGNILLRNVVGDVEASSMGGNVIFENVIPVGRGVRDGDVRVSTMGGNIKVPSAPFGAEIETMGGDIEIGEASGRVSASTMGGSIVIGALDGQVRADTMGGDIDVTMVGDPSRGNRGVRLSSEGGDVVLRVPRQLAMDVDITLAVTKRSGRSYKIRSDFDLKIRESDKWDYSADPPRRYIYGSGTTGSGQHRIKIETTDGNVQLLATK